jgi:hypothetical protein
MKWSSLKEILIFGLVFEWLKQYGGPFDIQTEICPVF